MLTDKERRHVAKVAAEIRQLTILVPIILFVVTAGLMLAVWWRDWTLVSHLSFAIVIASWAYGCVATMKRLAKAGAGGEPPRIRFNRAMQAVAIVLGVGCVAGLVHGIRDRPWWETGFWLGHVTLCVLLLGCLQWVALLAKALREGVRLGEE